MLLQAQRKAFYNDELLDMLTSAEEISKMSQQQFWQQFSDKMTTTIQQIIEFSKLIPGFTALSQDDQIMVLKGGELVGNRMGLSFGQTQSSSAAEFVCYLGYYYWLR